MPYMPYMAYFKSWACKLVVGFWTAYFLDEYIKIVKLHSNLFALI